MIDDALRELLRDAVASATRPLAVALAEQRAEFAEVRRRLDDALAALDRLRVAGAGRVYLTTEQAAEQLDVSERTIGRWVKSGALKSLRTPGGQLRIPVAEVERALHSRGTKQAAE